MRLLWSLPKVAPALLRHMAAYLELLGYELARAQRELVAGIIAYVVVAICLFFALLMGCAAVVALTWDTPHRLAAIAWMGGGFLAVAAIAILYQMNRGDQAPLLAALRREWREDCVILERILSDEE